MPADLPRVDHQHEPEHTACTTPGCGATLSRVSEDISEKLDYTPSVSKVERHVRGKWACAAMKEQLLACQVLHADETPVSVLASGQGKTQRAYLWVCASAVHEAQT